MRTRSIPSKPTCLLLLSSLLALVPPSAAQFQDGDRNGLRDDWEHRHFGTGNGSATADPDGDGLDNRSEMEAGTDPLDPASFLRPTLRLRSDGSGRELQLAPLTEGRRYHLEKAPHPDYPGRWHEVFAGEAPLGGDAVTIFDPDPPGHACFYRLLVDAGTVFPGTLYFVSNEGDDSHDGLTSETAWRTLAHVGARTFAPGDAILLRRGDTWRETLRVPSSGAADAYLSFAAYGKGSRPRILGSTRAVDWAPVEGHADIWRSSTPLPNPFDYYGAEVWFVAPDGSVTWGTHEGYGHTGDLSALAGLDREFEATWIGDPAYNADGHLYLFSPADPGERYAAVEVPVRSHIVELRDHEFLAFDQLQLLHGLTSGVRENYSPSYELRGLRITRSRIGYFGRKNGSNMYGLNVRHSDMYIAENEIHDCGRRGISLVVYDTQPTVTVENVLIENNHFHDGFHTTGVDSNNTGGHTIRDVTIRYNHFEGDPTVQLDVVGTTTIREGDPNSNHIFLANQGEAGSYVGEFRIYGNTFTHAHASAIKLESVEDIEIAHNTFHGFNPTVSNIQAQVYVSSIRHPVRDIRIRNNIFTLADVDANPLGLSCLKVDEAHRGAVTIHHNLFFADQPEGRLIRMNGGRHYAIAEWTAFVDETGYGSGSPAPADPAFVNAAEGDFRLLPASPAMDAGSPLDGISTQFAGSAPEIGAFEGGF